MKTLVFSLIVALIGSLKSEAQTQKGRWTVGAQIGSLSYQKENGNGSRIISVGVTPSAGYFVANGLVIGTGIPISTISIKTRDAGAVSQYDSRSSAVGLSPFVSYFFGQKKLKPYLGLAYSYSKTSYKSTRKEPAGNFESEGKGKTTALVPTVGLAYFISQNLSLTAGFNYNINHDDQEGTISVPGYSPNTSNYSSDTKLLSLNIGFQIFVGQ